MSLSRVSSKVLLKLSISCVGSFRMNPTVSLRRKGRLSMTTLRTVVSRVASIRQERVAELLKRELSILFQRESNTWFGGLFITVTQVRIGPDLGLAKVYLSFMATPDKEKALKEVEAEGWRVRKALGAKVGKQLRRVPELNFYLDDSLDFVDEVQRALHS